MTPTATSPAGAAAHAAQRRRHWDDVARTSAGHAGWSSYYHRRLRSIYQYWVTPGQRVLELGCGTGDLLAALEPAVGVGIDFSTDMLAKARERHPHLRFLEADAHDFALSETFDVIILSDLINDAWDVQAILERVAAVSTPHTRVIINTYSRLWEPLLAIAGALGLARPVLHQNWLAVADVRGLLSLAHFEVVHHSREILWPVNTPLLAAFFNKLFVRISPFKHLALTNVFIARPSPMLDTGGATERTLDDSATAAPASTPTGAPPTAAPNSAPLVSVIVPARNEAGNIAPLFSRLPSMGREVELVFVEGHSRDDTYAAIEHQIRAHPHVRCQLHRQEGTGKGDAVRLGFARATGEMLMILDADLTMPPEELPRFYRVLHSGQAEFVNGVRLVYPMAGDAMRPLNLIANHCFSWAFTWLLGQPVKDTLCGTKVLWKRDYERIVANRAYFGDFDPFGDFDLLFGAAKLGLKITDLPIRYRERTYGTTNINRWQHGWLLLRMTWFALWRMKFV